MILNTSHIGTYHWRKVIRPRILERDNYRCQIRDLAVCSNLDGRAMHPAELEVDHITPRNLGGSDKDTNLRASCRNCNRYRANKAKLRKSREW